MERSQRLDLNTAAQTVLRGIAGTQTAYYVLSSQKLKTSRTKELVLMKSNAHQ
jgi:hypothetical protein